MQYLTLAFDTIFQLNLMGSKSEASPANPRKSTKYTFKAGTDYFTKSSLIWYVYSKAKPSKWAILQVRTKSHFFMSGLGGKEYIKHHAVIGITQMFLPKASSPLMIKLSIEIVMKKD